MEWKIANENEMKMQSDEWKKWIKLKTKIVSFVFWIFFAQENINI